MVYRAVRAGVRAAALHWHKHHAPRHFGKRAKQRYKYRPRTLKYQRAKGRKWGHTRYLEWSGASRTALLAVMGLRVTGSRKRDVVRGLGKFRAPKHFFIDQSMRTKAPGPDMFDEFSRVVQTEMDEQARVGQKAFDQTMAREMRAHTRRKRIR